MTHRAIVGESPNQNGTRPHGCRGGGPSEKRRKMSGVDVDSALIALREMELAGFVERFRDAETNTMMFTTTPKFRAFLELNAG